jgi:hypothetical protein
MKDTVTTNYAAMYAVELLLHDRDVAQRVRQLICKHMCYQEKSERVEDAYSCQMTVLPV